MSPVRVRLPAPKCPSSKAAETRPFAFLRAERVGEVRDREAPPVPEQREHVVADLAGVGVAGQPERGEGDELALLVRVDRVVSGARGEALARLDLHECECAATANDDVDLAAAETHVACDDGVPAQAVEPRRAALAAGAERRRGDASL